MSPTVEAAWIAAATGGLGILSTAVVGIAGARNKRRTNGQTIDAAAADTLRVLDAARGDRLWDKKSDIYVDVLHALLGRRELREAETASMLGSFENEREVQAWLAAIKNPDWRDLEARAVAYGDQKVIHAIEASSAAFNTFYGLLTDRKEALGSGTAVPSSQQVEVAVQDAADADDKLSNAIRQCLHRKPSVELSAQEEQSSAPVERWPWKRLEAPWRQLIR